MSKKSYFRPLSLLSVFTKVLEKIFKDQLTSYLEANQVLVDFQYEFRKWKSTSDTVFVFNLDREINNAITPNNYGSLLLNKFENIEVKGKAPYAQAMPMWVF